MDVVKTKLIQKLVNRKKICFCHKIQYSIYSNNIFVLNELNENLQYHLEYTVDCPNFVRNIDIYLNIDKELFYKALNYAIYSSGHNESLSGVIKIVLN